LDDEAKKQAKSRKNIFYYTALIAIKSWKNQGQGAISPVRMIRIFEDMKF
jgi:hypothetical protein